MLILLLCPAIWVVTIGLMVLVDHLTDGVIADAFGKEWPYSRKDA